MATKKELEKFLNELKTLTPQERTVKIAEYKKREEEKAKAEIKQLQTAARQMTQAENERHEKSMRNAKFLLAGGMIKYYPKQAAEFINIFAKKEEFTKREAENLKVLLGYLGTPEEKIPDFKIRKPKTRKTPAKIDEDDNGIDIDV